MDSSCIIAACYNCDKAGNCEEKGEFDPEANIMPCYSFSPKSDVLTSAVKSARQLISIVSEGENDGEVQHR